MCGIIGIVGKNNENVVQKIISGLERLEYRGYDSAGIAVVSTKKEDNNKICRVRSAGKLTNLKEKLKKKQLQGYVGIGHTRWATHGKPTEINAHPMMSKDVALIHNGIIENYKELKFSLETDGYVFELETDTEVIAHLIQREFSKGLSPRESVRNAVKLLEGTYAIAVIFSTMPDTIIAVRHNSPVVVGFGENLCVGSDAGSLSSMCDEVAFLEDGDSVEISEKGAIFFDKNFKEVERSHVKIEKTGTVSKGIYPHFMLKEIMDQPISIRNTITRNTIDPSILNNVSRILIIACGTSFYAGMVAKYWIETFLKIPTDIEIASEFRYRNPVILDNTLMISISQSGETIDTLSAIEYVRSNSSCKTMAIVNVKNSAIARASDLVLYTEAGVEMCVASTKAFTAQLTVLASIAFCKNEFLQQQLHNLPTLCESILTTSEIIKTIAKKIYKSSSAIYLGRGNLYPIALEGALKLKEISYIHAEGFAAGEMKHGPIALIDENVPIIFLCPKNELFEKTVSNIQESMTRGKNIFVITDATNEEINGNIINIQMPSIQSALAPIVYSIPLQLLAYHTAVLRGTDVDRPRNLAKSVTVE
ncbi:MAG: glutamine--fructose-6-phosphate transaminase (isomerizing) [Alphaproteobacteria bacterium]|nr:glutamine--fructose-6-phosphate transaminase (isomerizing) [Alphaproteobacteria bacterium]